jgi:tetratricopeptide (TPR) repeat protein
LLALACALAVAGCTPSSNSGSVAPAPVASGSSPSPASTARPAIALPDLSAATPSVQRQIRDAHARLTTALRASVTPEGELAAAYGDLGRLLMAADYPDAAESSFLGARSLAAADVRWPYYLAHIRRKRGDLDGAQASFEEALRLRPDDLATLVWLGDVALSQGRPEEAEARLARALALNAASLSARYGLGRAALAKQDYARAVEHLEAVLARDPEAAAAHYPLAMAYRGLGDVKRADLHLRLRKNHEILPADPLMVEIDELLESPQAYESRGIRALDAERWSEAAAHFRKGLELAPESAALHHRLGTALYMMGDRAAARKEFETAVRVSPTFFLAQYSLGVLLQDEGRHADAVARFRAALDAQPTYTEARVRLGANLQRLGRAGEALRQYEEVLTVDAGHLEARFGLAMAAAALGRFRDARAALESGLRVHPEQSAFSHALARVLAAAPDDRVRDGARALALANELAARDGRSLELGETLAMALAEVGRFEDAAAVQRDLIRGAERAGLASVVPRLAANLALYERGQACRTPWAADEMR